MFSESASVARYVFTYEEFDSGLILFSMCIHRRSIKKTAQQTTEQTHKLKHLYTESVMR